VSLILEALKKVERDRQTHPRGFLVLGPPAWAPAGERAWTRRTPLLVAAALAGGAVAALLLWPGRSREAARPADSPPATRVAAADPSLAATDPSPAVPAPAAAAPPLAAAPPPALSSAPGPEPATPPTRQPLVTWRPVRGTPRPPVQPTPAAAAVQALQLQAISNRDGQPVAVVSGQLVRVGDRIGGGTVVRIGAAEIEIETDGNRQVLKF
jgi:hypothetical protein